MPESASTPSTSGSSNDSGSITLAPAVAAVSLKLPPYWPTDPSVWFAQVEAQFITRNITSQSTMFAYVISSLQPEIAQEIRDLLISPPTDEPYNKLKSELIRRTSASEQKRLNQLLISEELGDRKPSQLLRKMRQLVGDNRLEDGILRQLFLQRLPTNTQRILASTADNISLDELAVLADRILEVAPSQPSVAAIATTSQSASTVTEIEALRNQVNNLTNQVAALVNQLSIHPRSRSRSRGSSPYHFRTRRDSSNSRPDSNQPLCWYHLKFGLNAHHCKAPCSFTSSLPAQQSENSTASN